jgi:uncharacterized Fe-S cluster-containing radical SAM superfamily protein
MRERAKTSDCVQSYGYSVTCVGSHGRPWTLADELRAIPKRLGIDPSRIVGIRAVRHRNHIRMLVSWV